MTQSDPLHSLKLEVLSVIQKYYNQFRMPLDYAAVARKFARTITRNGTTLRQFITDLADARRLEHHITPQGREVLAPQGFSTNLDEAELIQELELCDKFKQRIKLRKKKVSTE